MATLRVTATRHCHTDRVSRDTYQGGEKAKHTTGTNGNQRQTAHSYTGSKQNKEALQNHVKDPTEHGRPDKLLTSIGTSQTFPKLHLATLNCNFHYQMKIALPQEALLVARLSEIG